MKKTIVVIASLVVVLIGSLPSCASKKQAQKTAADASGAAPVKVWKVARQKISERLSFTGTIEAWRKINITPEVGGKVAKIHVKEGDLVAAGQILAELDVESIRLQLKQAEAGAAVAEAAWNDAKKDKDRMDRLLKEKAVSDQQYEKVKLAFEAAQAQREQAVSGLDLARHALDVSIMKAPFAGVISSKNVEVGDVINPMMGGGLGPSGVLTLMDFSKVKIAVEVTPNDIARIRMNQKALLKVSSLPDREFEGQVTLVNPTADPATKKFRIEIAVDNRDLTLRPGTFGGITIEVQAHDDALAVPQTSVIENKYVFVVEGNKARKREVVLGLQNSHFVEILSGIKEGDIVVAEGSFGLEDGTEIRIEQEVQK